jgi:hypothetical protein
MLLSEQRIFHTELKQKYSIKSELSKWERKNLKVAPDNENSVSVGPTKIIRLKKRLQLIEQSLINREGRQQNEIQSTLKASLCGVFQEYKSLWECLQIIFADMANAIPNNGSPKEEKPSMLTLQKQKLILEMNGSLLLEWKRTSRNCVIAWDDLTNSEHRHSINLHSWASNLDHKVTFLLTST